MIEWWSRSKIGSHWSGHSYIRCLLRHQIQLSPAFWAILAAICLTSHILSSLWFANTCRSNQCEPISLSSICCIKLQCSTAGPNLHTGLREIGYCRDVVLYLQFQSTKIRYLVLNLLYSWQGQVLYLQVFVIFSKLGRYIWPWTAFTTIVFFALCSLRDHVCSTGWLKK